MLNSGLIELFLLLLVLWPRCGSTNLRIYMKSSTLRCAITCVHPWAWPRRESSWSRSSCTTTPATSWKILHLWTGCATISPHRKWQLCTSVCSSMSNGDGGVFSTVPQPSPLCPSISSSGICFPPWLAKRRLPGTIPLHLASIRDGCYLTSDSKTY